MNVTLDSPTAAPKTPEWSVANEVQPPTFYPISIGSDPDFLFWNGPIDDHLLIPMLSPPRSPRDDDMEDGSSMDTSAYLAPLVPRYPRLKPIVRNVEFTPITKEKNLESEAKYLNESFTTLEPDAKYLNESFTALESTWCLSYPYKQNHDDWNNDDASLDYSIDEEIEGLTLRSYEYRRCPSRPTSKMSFDETFSPASIPSQIVVPEDYNESPSFSRL
jgi:hypothetical protein